MTNFDLLYIDLFCGAGGTSTGVELARLDGRKCAKVIACVNHDPHAIESHQANHPDVLHFTEDIRTLDLTRLIEHTNMMRAKHPEARLVLWASLECTNFSKAKGGLPRDADSRTLAEHLFRYIEGLNPDFIHIENVEEFMSWGDLDATGKPVSKDKGRSYIRWINKVKSYGYHFDHRILNAADYGAYTSRKRYFGQFAKVGLPIEFPMPTYSKTGKSDIFNQYRKWKPVRDVLDLKDEGESIFGRKRPLVEKTLSRIYAGLLKFVAGGEDRFLIKYNSTNGKTGKHIPPSIDEPCPTVACQNRLGVTKVQFLSKQYSGDPKNKNISIEGPAGTVTTKDHHAFITAQYGHGYNASIDKPAGTITTNNKLGLVSVTPTEYEPFITAYYGNGYSASLDEPAGTVTTKDRFSLVSPKFLMNPQYQSKGGSIDSPCFTLIARMDKCPPYLISTDKGLGIKIYDDDSPMTKKIKEFMAVYGIIDIKMRMLNIKELKRIMGFPENYTLVGTSAEKMKYVGNAVEVNMSKVLCETLCGELRRAKIKVKSA